MESAKKLIAVVIQPYSVPVEDAALLKGWNDRLLVDRPNLDVLTTILGYSFLQVRHQRFHVIRLAHQKCGVIGERYRNQSTARKPAIDPAKYLANLTVLPGGEVVYTIGW